jgi:hypothetical protein
MNSTKPSDYRKKLNLIRFSRFQRESKLKNGGKEERELLEKDPNKKLLLQSLLNHSLKKRSRRISEKIKVIDYRANDSIANVIDK